MTTINLGMKVTKAQKEYADGILRNWNELAKRLKGLAKEDVAMLLAHEVQTKRRMAVVQRLVARLGVLERQSLEATVLGFIAANP